MAKLSQEKFCECGKCSRVVKPGNRFISGHNPGPVSKRLKQISIPNHHLCACRKCNKMIASDKIYVQGHNGVLNTWIKGRKAWNKGLTKETDERVAKYAKSLLGITFNENRKQKIKDYQNLYETKLAKSIRHKNKIFSIETIEKISKKCREISLNLWSNQQFREKMSGENSSLWRGGISSLEYNKNWTKKLKESIRKRDNDECSFCNISQDWLKYKLHIHHIDYNKKNCDPTNLITLCLRCHAKTNVILSSRYHFTLIFQRYINYIYQPKISDYYDYNNHLNEIYCDYGKSRLKYKQNTNF